MPRAAAQSPASAVPPSANVAACRIGALTDAPPPASRSNQFAIQLGARLFFDPALSADGAVSCASCHVPANAFADGLRLARGLGGANGTRNTPSLVNASRLHDRFGWDGRHASLVDQMAAPLFNPAEHGLDSPRQLAKQLAGSAPYRRAFKLAFGPGPVVPAKVYEALAAFVSSLVSGDSAFDRWRECSEDGAISAAAQRGHALFVGRAGCALCHITVGGARASFTDNMFHSLGLGSTDLAGRLAELLRRVAADAPTVNDNDAAPLGRFLVTHEPSDIAAFRTPSLRNVALTAPYLHDGRLGTLREAVDWELDYRGGQNGMALVFTPGERTDLVAFLESLTSDDLADLAAWARQAAKPSTPGPAAPPWSGGTKACVASR